MPDDKLEDYSHAMIIDEDTGKPMMKVYAQGPGLGGVDESMLEDYYTKEESDDIYQQKGDYATTSQVGQKADASSLKKLEDTVSDLKKRLEEIDANPETEGGG